MFWMMSRVSASISIGRADYPDSSSRQDRHRLVRVHLSVLRLDCREDRRHPVPAIDSHEIGMRIRSVVALPGGDERGSAAASPPRNSRCRDDAERGVAHIRQLLVRGDVLRPHQLMPAAARPRSP